MSHGGTVLAPVVLEMVLTGPVERAFTVFTEGIGGWWPAAFTSSGDRLAAVVLEPHVGGRVFERDRDGRESDWGAVLDFQPGHSVTMTWGLGLQHLTEVEVGFTGAPIEGGTGPQWGTSVRLEHRGWLPEQVGEREKFAHPEGWARVLASYREAVESAG
jgi:uncharacterized protein YndB with AHSA1/START domain